MCPWFFVYHALSLSRPQRVAEREKNGQGHAADLNESRTGALRSRDPRCQQMDLSSEEDEVVEVLEDEDEDELSSKRIAAAERKSARPHAATAARDLSGATGILDTPWGDAQSASWTVHISFGGGALAPDMKVDLHNIAGSGSDFIAGVMGAHSFSGDTHLTLDPAWRHCAAPLLRCLYSPEAASFFIEQLLVRKTFSQAVAVCHCALYLGLGPAFFDDLYAKIAARRTVLTRDMACGNADADQFRCPAAGDDTAAAATWSNLPLHHALRWLHALGLKKKAQLANVLLYVEADGCSLKRVRECAAEWHSERKARHAECVARAKLDSETWEPHAEWAEHEAAQWREFAGWNLSLTEVSLTEAGAEAGAEVEAEAERQAAQAEAEAEAKAAQVVAQAEADTEAEFVHLAEAEVGVNLKVIVLHFEVDSEIDFKMKETTPLQKLMNAVCRREGVPNNSIRFLFDGNVINETQTPQQVCCLPPAEAQRSHCPVLAVCTAPPPPPPRSHCVTACRQHYDTPVCTACLLRAGPFTPVA